jgi:homogentisate 1,2-dioxygenase
MVVTKGTIGRRGEQGEYFEHSYTRKGFFGAYARMYKIRDPGRPKRISGGLCPRFFNLEKLVTADMNDPKATPSKLLHSDYVSISVFRRRKPMPYCFRNSDGDELFFYHKGEFRVETEFGLLQANPGDFVFIPRNVVYRQEPVTDDNLVIVIETKDDLNLADRYHREHGLTDAALDLSAVRLPELSPVDDGSGIEHELKIKYLGDFHSVFYDFDPTRVTVGWKGDPIVFKISAWDIPGARSPFTPPTSAVFMTESKDCVIGIRRPGGGERSSGPPAHSNDYDEVWFYHSSSQDEGVGVLKLDPQGLTQAGRRGMPSGERPQPDPKRMSLNIDTHRPLCLTSDATSCEVQSRMG